MTWDTFRTHCLVAATVVVVVSAAALGLASFFAVLALPGEEHEVTVAQSLGVARHDVTRLRGNKFRVLHRGADAVYVRRYLCDLDGHCKRLVEE